MLKPIAVGVVASTFLVASAVAAEPSDPVFVKGKGNDRIDFVLQVKGEQNDRPKPSSQPTSNQDRPLTLSDAVRAMCASTLMVDQGFISESPTPVCWQLQPQDGQGGADSAALARTLRDGIRLDAPSVRTSPSSPTKAVVGLETWLWVGSGDWQPISKSGSLGGATVEVTARPLDLRWDMGESSVSCAGPGRAWNGDGVGVEAPCGYTYEHTSTREPGGKFVVSGRIRYAVTWTCEGACSSEGGDLGDLESPAGRTDLEVTERQAVVER